MEQVATGCVGRCLENLFPKGSPFLPSAIISSLLSAASLSSTSRFEWQTLSSHDELLRALPIALDSESSLVRKVGNLGGTFMGLGVFSLLGEPVVFAFGSVACTAVAAADLVEGATVSEAVRDGGRFFNPRFYVNGYAYGSGCWLDNTTERKVACWQGFLILALDVLGGDSAGDAFGNQAKLADIMRA